MKILPPALPDVLLLQSLDALGAVSPLLERLRSLCRPPDARSGVSPGSSPATRDAGRKLRAASVTTLATAPAAVWTASDVAEAASEPASATARPALLRRAGPGQGGRRGAGRGDQRVGQDLAAEAGIEERAEGVRLAHRLRHLHAGHLLRQPSALLRGFRFPFAIRPSGSGQAYRTTGTRRREFHERSGASSGRAAEAPRAPPRRARSSRHRELGRARRLPFLVRGDASGRPRALDQVLDLHLAAGALVGALDDHAGAAAPVGVFHLRLHAGRAEIELGPDAGLGAGCEPCAGRRRSRPGPSPAPRPGPVVPLPRRSGSRPPAAPTSSRETPIEKPVAGTGSARKRPTSPS